VATVTRPAGPSTLAAFRAIVAGRRTDPDFFVRAARKHPRIAHVRLGSEHLYLLSHPDLVRRLLVDAGRTTTKSRGLQAARRVLADGLLTSEDPLHHRQRRLVQPAFHAARVASYAAGMIAAADSTAAGWRDGARVDMAGEMSALTFDAVGRALFSSDLRGAAGEVRAALGDLLSAYHRSFLPGFDLALRLGTPLGRRVTAAQARLDAVVARIIAGHRAQDESADLLSALMAARDDDGGMDERQLRDEVMTLILAGHETTATTLTFVWHLLSTHPAAERWLHEEIDEVIGARTPSPADLDRLPRARSVVAESLRLYPPAWVLGRRLTAEMEVDGWLIPPGSTCLVSQWVLHRDPRFWSDPQDFRPERWIGPSGGFDETAPGQPRYAFFPFGAGGRMCVGEPFAWTEAVLVLARLARHWQPRHDPDHVLRLRPAITLRPDGALPMTLVAR
jgi:cytochrome P450